MVSIKLLYKGAIKRLESLPESFDDFKEIVKEISEVENPSFWYIDEDDETIIFDTENEYQDIRKSEFQKLKIGIENKLSLSSLRSFSSLGMKPLTCSFSEPISMSIIPRKQPLKFTKEVWDERVLNETETQTEEIISNEKESQASFDLNTIIDKVKETIKRTEKIVVLPAEKLDMEMVCECGLNIFSELYKCEKCELYLCKRCGLTKYHQHNLTRTKFKRYNPVQKISSFPQTRDAQNHEKFEHERKIKDCHNLTSKTTRK